MRAITIPNQAMEQNKQSNLEYEIHSHEIPLGFKCSLTSNSESR